MVNGKYLAHFGIPGMKWGQRRFQNEDGTYTEEGKRRRRIGEGDRFARQKTYVKNLSKKTINAGKNAVKVALKQAVAGAKDGLKDAPYKVTKAVVGGAAILATAKIVEKFLGNSNYVAFLAAYNAYNKKNKIGNLPNIFESMENSEDE